MIPKYCTICKSKHYDHMECSNCGAEYSSIVPKFSHGSVHSKTFGKQLKYCSMCGHKFDYKEVKKVIKETMKKVE